MTKFPTRVWSSAALLGALLAAIAWAVSDLQAARHALGEAERQLGDCVKLGAEIAAAQQHRAQVSVRLLTDGEVLDHVEAARDRSKLPTEVVSAVESLPSVRFGSTDFKRQETLVQLRPMELQSVAEWMSHIDETASGLRVSRLRLTGGGAPRAGPATRELWGVEISLTQTVYDPITAR